MTADRLCVVIPALNEAAMIGSTLDRVRRVAAGADRYPLVTRARQALTVYRRGVLGHLIHAQRRIVPFHVLGIGVAAAAQRRHVEGVARRAAIGRDRGGAEGPGFFLRRVAGPGSV